MFTFRYIEATCEVTQATPIHIAIEAGHMNCIQELLVCGAKLDLADRSGDNVFHYAAKTNNANIIQVCEMYFHVFPRKSKHFIGVVLSMGRG